MARKRCEATVARPLACTGARLHDPSRCRRMARHPTLSVRYRWYPPTLFCVLPARKKMLQGLPKFIHGILEAPKISRASSDLSRDLRLRRGGASSASGRTTIALGQPGGCGQFSHTPTRIRKVSAECHSLGIPLIHHSSRQIYAGVQYLTGSLCCRVWHRYRKIGRSASPTSSSRCSVIHIRTPRLPTLCERRHGSPGLSG